MLAGRLLVALSVGALLVALCPVDGARMSTIRGRSADAAGHAGEDDVDAIDAIDDADTDVVVNDDDTSLTTSLSFWGIVRSVWHWVRDDLRESLLNDSSSHGHNASTDLAGAGDAETETNAATAEGRTFGKIRRLQMALIPIVFKFGVLSAMVGFLVLLGMKTLFLVKVLVLMNAIAILAKFLTFKSGLGHVEHTVSAPIASQWAGGYSSNWSPSASSGWTSPGTSAYTPHQHNNKEIHLHIHGAGAGAQVQTGTSYGSSYGTPQAHQQTGWERRSDPYGAYEPQATDIVNSNNELNEDGTLPEAAPKIPHNHRMY